MIQGTTPTITLRLPLPTSEITGAEFVIADGQNNILRKWTLPEMAVLETALAITLTQEDTIALEPTIYKSQLRIKTADGAVMATKQMPIPICDLISRDVM